MPITNQQRLRRMVGDRIPPGGDENSAFFSDAEIDDLISEAGESLNTAAFYGWLAKMAEFAKLVDRNVSGADMRLSQMYKQAEAMAKHYGTLAGVTEAVIGRMVGRAVNLREEPCAPRVMPVSSGFRLEARNAEAKRIMQRSEPETLEDPTYPAPGPVATS